MKELSETSTDSLLKTANIILVKLHVWLLGLKAYPWSTAPK